MYNFEKKRSISIRLLIVTNCSIKFAFFLFFCCFFFLIEDFFSKTEQKKITIDSDFIVGVLNILKSV